MSNALTPAKPEKVLTKRQAERLRLKQIIAYRNGWDASSRCLHGGCKKRGRHFLMVLSLSLDDNGIPCHKYWAVGMWCRHDIVLATRNYQAKYGQDYIIVDQIEANVWESLNADVVR